MNLYSQAELVSLAVQGGFHPDNAPIAAAIALCEAPYVRNNETFADFDAVGDQKLADATWGYSYGAWQIRSLRADKGTGRIRDEDKLPDPLFNAKSARAIKIHAGSFRPWSTFTSGMYKAYLQDMYPPPPNCYVVVAGDYLSKIAIKLGGEFSWVDLAAANGLQSPYTIQIGQILVLPEPTPGA